MSLWTHPSGLPFTIGAHKFVHREIFRDPEISYREWHIVDTADRETIVSRVDSPGQDLMEIHDSALKLSCAPSSSSPHSHNTHPLPVRFIGNHGKGEFILI